MKLKIAAVNGQAHSVIITKIKTGEKKEFLSIRKAAKFLGKHHSYLAKCLQKQKLYKGKEYTLVKK